MLFVTFFLTVTLFVYTLLLILEERTFRIKRRLAMISEVTASEPKSKLEMKGRLSVYWKFVKQQSRREKQRETVDRLELKLIQAGKPFELNPVGFRMLQISLLLVIPLLFGIYAVILRISFGSILIFVLLGMGTAAILPFVYLRLKTKQRLKAALKELPDVLDLLTVSLEAGLGFDAALNKLVSKKGGVLSEEFQRCLEEIRLGKTRREALLGIRDRIELDELKLTIGSILQSERLGIGLVQVLRVQSQEVREQRKQRAEEEAMKAPIKMLFPLVLFIFPSLFIVLLGPALIQFIQTFSQ